MIRGVIVIENAIDMVFFSRRYRLRHSRIMAYLTVSANYRLTTNIDMSKVAPGAYRTPSVNFNGMLNRE
ncbi:MAG: hypothetical protein MZU97_24130 [Bacillus subtilis]|nr:hypothetical protein [Bacillus subtilis]